MFLTADRINDSISEVIQEKFNFMEYMANLNELSSDEIPLQQKFITVSPVAKNREKDLLSLSFIDANGDAYITPEFKINFGHIPIVQQVLKSGKTTMAGPSADAQTGELSINIAAPVKNEDGKINGVLFARFNSNFLCDISQRIKIGETGYAIVIDRASGNTIGAPDKQDVIKQQNLKTISEEEVIPELTENMINIMDGKTDVGYYTRNNVRHIMIYQPVKNTNWSVVIISDDNEFIKNLTGMEKILFYLTLVVIFVAAVVSLTIARTLTPLKQVGDAISEIATGNADLTQRLTVKKGKKEVLDIVNGFYNFVAKLQEIIASMKESENQLSNADGSLKAGTQDTAASITEIIANIESVNSQILNQVSSVDETAGAVNEIAANIDSLEKMIMKQSEGVAEASSAIEQMVGNINSVNMSADKMFDSFRKLEQNATVGIQTQSQVNNIIQQIETQSKTIGDELTKIQESIANVVNVSSSATDAFKAVSESIRDTDQIVRQIKNAMEEQQIGSKQITEVLHNMNDSTIEVKSASTEMAAGAQRINQTGASLSHVSKEVTDSIDSIKAEINQFKI